MDLQLKDKVAVVMAASKGLGKATARIMAEEGARVVISARHEAELSATAAEIHAATGADVSPFVADSSRAADVQALMDFAYAKHGRLDCLVSNAGGPPGGRFETQDDGVWQSAIDLILMRAVRSARAAIPIMKRQGGGSITFIESASVKNLIDGLILSNSIRMAVVGLAKTLAHEHGPDNIRFNVVCPGATATDRILQLARSDAQRAGTPVEEEVKRRGSGIPLRRVADPLEFGRVCAFIASPAASFVTGASIIVDGGVGRAA